MISKPHVNGCCEVMLSDRRSSYLNKRDLKSSINSNYIIDFTLLER